MKNKSRIYVFRNTLLVIFSFILTYIGICQSDQKILKDTLDNKLDASIWLMKQSGFLPFISIITEPATDYGLAAGALFFDPFSKRRGETIGGVMKEKEAPPDIAAVAAFGTLNKSWGALINYRGFWLKDKLRYTGVVAWLDINLNYYGDLKNSIEEPILFNYQGFLFLQQLDARIVKNVYGGLRYLLFKFKISANGSEIPDFITEKELNAISSNIAPVIYFDSRDNIFTPDKGLFAKVLYNINDSWLGSDFTYNLFETYCIGFIPVKSRYIIGLRYTGKFISEDAPFFAEPFIDLRGIPIMRYQSQYVLELETEHRYNITNRWALIGFVGLGKAFYDNESFNNSDNIFAGGAGFRYLIARLFKMWGGIDVAKGPERWAFYITLGHAWGRY